MLLNVVIDCHRRNLDHLNFSLIAGLDLNAHRLVVLLALADLLAVRPTGQRLPLVVLLTSLGDDVGVVDSDWIQATHCQDLLEL